MEAEEQQPPLGEDGCCWSWWRGRLWSARRVKITRSDLWLFFFSFFFFLNISMEVGLDLAWNHGAECSHRCCGPRDPSGYWSSFTTRSTVCKLLSFFSDLFLIWVRFSDRWGDNRRVDQRSETSVRRYKHLLSGRWWPSAFALNIFKLNFIFRKRWFNCRCFIH